MPCLWTALETHCLSWNLPNPWWYPCYLVRLLDPWFRYISSASLIFIEADILKIFFAERVRIVSGKYYIPVICWVLSSVRGIMTLVAMVGALQMVTLEQYQKDSKWLLASILSIGAAVDLVVAGSLSYYLRTRSRRQVSILSFCWVKVTKSWSSTSSAVDKVIAWTIRENHPNF